MRKDVFQILALIVLGFSGLLLGIQPGQAEFVEGRQIVAPRPALAQAVAPLGKRLPAARLSPLPQPDSVPSTACALRPDPQPNKAFLSLAPVREQPPLSRFRRVSTDDRPQLADPSRYQPPEEIALAHPTNFGQRFLQDINGNVVQQEPILVLHETVGSAEGTIGFFQTPHPNDDDQVSYHTLIKPDGTVVYVVPPDQRAFGAGNSVFEGAKGIETVQTNPRFPPSVNNFAYHISLVTPPDGRDNARVHSGYTRLQYQSLAWLVAKTGIPESRITTHKDVDRSRQRIDPRSLNGQSFGKLLGTYPKTQEISIQCTLPEADQG